MKLLLDKGADANEKGHNDFTVLMWAAEKGFLEEAKLLVERGADVNAKDIKGRTALMWTATRGHVEVARLLLAKGADFKVGTILAYSAERAEPWHKEIEELLCAVEQKNEASEGRGKTDEGLVADPKTLKRQNCAPFLVSGGTYVLSQVRM